MDIIVRNEVSVLGRRSFFVHPKRVKLSLIGGLKLWRRERDRQDESTKRGEDVSE